ncbi:MAG: protein kinase [Myxococcales bacterium]|nr:protein kinase [Myxococcales bacterium]
MAGDRKSGLDHSFGAARSLPPRIEVQQVKASVRARLFGITEEVPRLGDYRISRRIGRGGMGAVYEAVDSRGDVVALKTLRGFSPAMLYHLKNEFRALSGVTHPNLVGLDKLYVTGTQAYFTMELVDGVDLVRYVRRDAPRGFVDDALIGRLRNVLPQIVDAVSCLHRAGKLHRDLKPSNVLVTSKGRAVVLDFGLARDITEVSTLSSSNESFVGTPAYMAPELASGDSLSQAGDWYAVGVILYEALVGALPFDGSGFQVLLDKCRVPAPRVEKAAVAAPADLANLCNRLLERDPALRPSCAEIREFVGNPTTPTIARGPSISSVLGREAELKELWRLCDAVSDDGRPRVACVSGESGIGKSALLQEFVSEAQRRLRAAVIVGRCYTSESVPYRALDPLIDGITRILVDYPPEESAAFAPPERQALVRLFPVLGRVTGFTPLPGEEPLTEDVLEIQRRAVAGLRRLLGALGHDRPLVLVIDDLQWSDDDSAVLLRELLVAADSPAILVVVGIREEAVDDNAVLRLLAESEVAPEVTKIELGPLSEGEARRLVASLADVDPEDERLGPLIREAGGVPFFLVELARHLAGADDTAAKVAFDAMIRGRVASLPEPAQNLLQVLAIAGRPLSRSVAVRAAGAGSTGRSMIPRLRAANLICERITDGDAELEIFHERIRREIVDGIPKNLLPTVHRALALALAEAGEPPGFLATHFRAAGLRQLALRYSIEAGDSAVTELAFRRAAGFYSTALELVGGGPSRREIHRRLAEALVHLGRGEAAAENYFAAAVGADPEEALALRRSAAMMLLRSGEITRGTAALRLVLREVEESWPGGRTRAVLALGAERLRLRLRGQGFTLRRAGNIEPKERAHLETLAAAREGFSSSDPLMAMVFQARFLRRALDIGEPNYLVPALCGEAAFVAHLGGGGRVGRILERARGLLNACDDPRAQESWLLCSAVVAFSRGRWVETIEWIHELNALGLRHQGSGYIATMAGFFELNSLFYLGRLRELRERREACLKGVDEAGDRCGSTTLRAGLQVFAHLAADNPDVAARELEVAVGRWPAKQFVVQRAWAFLGERAVDLYSGDLDRAWARLEAAWPEYRRNVAFAGSYLRIMGRLWRANIALACAASGRRRLADVAAGELHEMSVERAAWAEPFVDLVRGGVMALRGSHDRAITAYRAAAEGFTARDMTLWSAAARLRLGELTGGDRGREATEEADALARAEGVVAPARLLATLAPRVR